MRPSIIFSLLLMSGFGLQVGHAQQSPGAKPPMPPVLTGGQDLLSLNYERPARLHPPEPIEAGRAARARRQAQFYRDYPGTPLNSFAALAADPNRSVQ